MVKVDAFMKFFELKKGELNPNVEMLIDDCSNYDPALREYSIIFRKERKPEFIKELDSQFESYLDSNLEVFIESCKESPGKIIIATAQVSIGRYVYEKTGTVEKFLEFFGMGKKEEETAVDGNEVMQILATAEFESQTESDELHNSNSTDLGKDLEMSVTKEEMEMLLSNRDSNTENLGELGADLSITQDQLTNTEETLEIPASGSMDLSLDNPSGSSSDELIIEEQDITIDLEQELSINEALPTNEQNIDVDGSDLTGQDEDSLEIPQDVTTDWTLELTSNSSSASDPFMTDLGIAFNNEVASSQESVSQEIEVEGSNLGTDLGSAEIQEEESIEINIPEETEEAVEVEGTLEAEEVGETQQDGHQESSQQDSNLSSNIEEVNHSNVTAQSDGVISQDSTIVEEYQEPVSEFDNPLKQLHQESQRTVQVMEETSKEVIQMMQQMHEEIQKASVQLTGKMETNDFPILSTEDFHIFMSQMEKTSSEHIKRLFMFTLKTYWRAGNVGFVSRICNEFIELDSEIGRRY